jgi:hypothetical protein
MAGSNKQAAGSKRVAGGKVATFNPVSAGGNASLRRGQRLEGITARRAALSPGNARKQSQAAVTQLRARNFDFSVMPNDGFSANVRRLQQAFRISNRQATQMLWANQYTIGTREGVDKDAAVKWLAQNRKRYA